MAGEIEIESGMRDAEATHLRESRSGTNLAFCYVMLVLPEEDTTFCPLLPYRVLTMARPRAPERSSSRPTIPPIIVFLYGIGALCLHFWLNRVCRVVPEAYLDEVFHIPQAQAYWAGSWQTWDPKITTPPGLYIYSCLFAKLLTVFGWRELGVRQLRVSVEVLLMFMPMILLQCHPRYHNYKQWSPKLLAQIMHANLNTIFCPLLFFFSALYYTDILSAFAVVEVYGWYVYFGSEKEPGGYLSSKLSAGARSVTCKIAILLFGLFAMLCRQTNVFWVAVFLGGLQAVRTLTTCTHSGPSIAARKRPISANLNVVFDPPVQDAAIEGMWRAFNSVRRLTFYRLCADCVLPALDCFAAHSATDW